jgi:hypothetical protein
MVERKKEREKRNNDNITITYWSILRIKNFKDERREKGLLKKKAGLN